MRTARFMFSSTHRLTHSVGVVVLGIIFSMSPRSLAVTIDFDDLVPIYDPTFPCFCDNPLTDQYASKGLLIENAYLNGESHDGGLTYENILLSGPYTRLNFIGNLPTFVEMYVTSAHEDAIYLTAFGVDGFISSAQTPGFAGSDDDPPAAPNQLVSFSSALGIQSITIDSFYFLRTGASIDNLTYTYASAVPEPSSLALLIVGLVPLTLRGARTKLEIRRNKRR